MSHLYFHHAPRFHYSRYLTEYYLGLNLVEVLQDGICKGSVKNIRFERHKARVAADDRNCTLFSRCHPSGSYDSAERWIDSNHSPSLPNGR